MFDALIVSWPLLAGLVVLLAAVQSVFGVGLLVFGTPVLLLLGLPFSQVLSYLLPCSITVSALQVATTGGLTLDPMRRRFLVITVPAVVVATVVTLTWGSPSQIRLVVGAMLIVSALLRVASGGAHSRVDARMQRHQRPLFLLLGLVHGASNLGGGLLTALVGGSSQDKDVIRRQIAFCYGAMAAMQLLVLLASGDLVVSAMSLLLPLLAAATYLLVGQRVFRQAGQFGYQRALTAMILGVGLLLVAT
jgi:hypothetical protein